MAGDGLMAAVGDVDGDGRPGLLIGAAGENDPQGAVWVIPGGTARPLHSSGVVFTTTGLGLSAEYGTLPGGDVLR
jgi:hypothetical protein